MLMNLNVKDLCLLQLSLMILIAGLMLILVSLGDHRAAELSLQKNHYIFYNMQVDLVVA